MYLSKVPDIAYGRFAIFIRRLRINRLWGWNKDSFDVHEICRHTTKNLKASRANQTTKKFTEESEQNKHQQSMLADVQQKLMSSHVESIFVYFDIFNWQQRNKAWDNQYFDVYCKKKKNVIWIKQNISCQ